MRIWICCDLEGVAGVASFEDQAFPEGRYYEQAKRLATLELNALVEGALQGGAQEIIALDGHGAGGIDPELLHPACQLLLGPTRAVPWGLDNAYDAALLHGHHPMAGTPGGVLAHTLDSETIAEMTLNGQPVGEIGTNMALAGYFGVPTVLVTGDRAAAEEARALVPEIETVAVKSGPADGGVLSLSPARAREVIRDGARRALQRWREIPPYVVAPPYERRTRYYDYLHADAVERAGAQRVDQYTVAVSADDYLELMRR